MPLNLIVHGAAGRMGRRVVALAAEDRDIRLVAAIENTRHPLLGEDAGRLAGAVDAPRLPLTSVWPDAADVVIDFSKAEAVPRLVEECTRRSLAVVLATTGLTEEAQRDIERAAERIPVVWAPSMSLAVNLTMRLAQQATRALQHVPGGVDVEIIERHHRYKVDAPSGTALKFGELIAEAFDGEVEHVHGRQGVTGRRPGKQIGYHAVRTGDDPGQHTIVFGMLGETLELRVAASNRDCYASGALAAAHWVRGKPPGRYSMFDVLGLT